LIVVVIVSVAIDDHMDCLQSVELLDDSVGEF